MNAYHKTTLWQSSLAPRTDDDFATEREMLRSCLLDFRNRVAYLVLEISKDLPGLTVHDVTHLDALWEVASTIAGSEYSLNPAEAFVLGGAILLHDAGMCVAAYPDGLEGCKATPQWKDAVVDLLRKRGTKDPTEDEIESPSLKVAENATAQVLRALHAARAKDLGCMQWKTDPKGAPEFLIQNSDLRNFYGPIIGEIGASHWWSVNDLQKLPSILSAGPGVTAQWTVDPIKIACLLRVADAAHIDHRRAPRFLRSLVKPAGVSASHWAFQEKLGKPVSDGDALVISAGNKFAHDEAEAWWLCFDTVQMIDRELSQVDALLQDLRKERFAVRRVSGADSPARFQRFVRTSRWQPIDARIKVSDVPAIAKMLGGEQLYGDDPSISVRELIQNAADAIRARRIQCDLEDEYGLIRAELQDRDDGFWLVVEDNGVGMSRHVLTGELLDFGKSFWHGDGVRREFVGLLSKGMKATGKFGIGFFSVFMLGKGVVVTSRRYDQGVDESYTLEFRKGLELRPLLREPFQHEAMNDGGTRVSVRLDRPPNDEGGLLRDVQLFHGRSSFSLCSLVASICPTLDVHVDTIEFGERSRAVSANDWKTLNLDEIVIRLNRGSKPFSRPDTLSNLTGQNGEVLGRATVNPYQYGAGSRKSGVITIGGFSANKCSYVIGLLLGEDAVTVTRDYAVPCVPQSALRDWTHDQAEMIANSSLSDWDKLGASAVILCAGGIPTNLPVAKKGGTYLTFDTLVEMISRSCEIVVCSEVDLAYDEDLDDVKESKFDDQFDVDESIIVLPTAVNALAKVGNMRWPSLLPEYKALKEPKTPFELLGIAISSVWGDEYNEQMEYRTVGEVEYTDIERLVTVFSREADEQQSE